MGKETYLQADLFSGELVDNRTRKQKRQAKAQEGPQQGMLFSQREQIEFGVNAQPLMPLSPHTSLRLIAEDPRTEEEKEADARRAVLESLTAFPGLDHPLGELETGQGEPGENGDGATQISADS